MIVVVAAGRWRRRGLVVEGGGERLVLGDGMGTLAPLTLAHARLNCAVARAVMAPVEMVTDQAACYLRVLEQMLPEALRQHFSLLILVAAGPVPYTNTVPEASTPSSLRKVCEPARDSGSGTHPPSSSHRVAAPTTGPNISSDWGAGHGPYPAHRYS